MEVTFCNVVYMELFYVSARFLTKPHIRSVLVSDALCNASFRCQVEADLMFQSGRGSHHQPCGREFRRGLQVYGMLFSVGKKQSLG